MKTRMKARGIRYIALAMLTAGSVLFTGCSGASTQVSTDTSQAGEKTQEQSGANQGASQSDDGGNVQGGRATRNKILVPEALGTESYGSDGVTIDASNKSEGYIMVGYEGSAEKVKLQITAPDDVQYTYNLEIGQMEAFPLVAGDGAYTVDVLEHAYDNMYALITTETLDVTIADELTPFLYPNQYVRFKESDTPVQFAKELSDGAGDDLDYVEAVYEYVIENVTYDTEKAENVTTGYLPDINDTMESGKGICFDYASLTASMLRSQGVPTKLQVGYSGDAYHAWISVYLDEIGWVDNIIEFDGSNWSLIDPTLAANNSAGNVKQYIGDGTNYTLKYSY